LCGMYCPDFAIFGFKPEVDKKTQAEPVQPTKEASAVPLLLSTENKEEQDAR